VRGYAAHAVMVGRKVIRAEIDVGFQTDDDSNSPNQIAASARRKSSR
jgi:hypothetical protein